MKKGISVVVFLTVPFFVYAQSEKDDFKTMIDTAIQIKYLPFVHNLKAAGRDQGDLYLIDEQNRSLNYLHLPDSFKLRFINIFDTQNRKIMKKGIHAWKVLTKLNKNQFEVSIIDFRIKYTGKNNYDFSNGGGAGAIFEYDCNENKWKLVSSVDRGI
jgi:hypothetical protein